MGQILTNFVLVYVVPLIIVFWVARRNCEMLALKNVSDVELYKQHISKEITSCIVFMCLFGLIAVLGVVRIIQHPLVPLWGLVDLIRWNGVRQTLLLVLFSLGMVAYLAFKTREYKQEVQAIENASNVELYRKHISREYIACIFLICLFGLIGLLGIVRIPNIIHSILTLGGLRWFILYSNIGIESLLVIPSVLFSFGMIFFLALKTKGYKQEMMIKEQIAAYAGLTYYKYISQKYVICVILICAFILGAILWLYFWLFSFTLVDSILSQFFLRNTGTGVLDYFMENQPMDWLYDELFE